MSLCKTRDSLFDYICSD